MDAAAAWQMHRHWRNARLGSVCRPAMLSFERGRLCQQNSSKHLHATLARRHGPPITQVVARPAAAVLGPRCAALSSRQRREGSYGPGTATRA